MQLASPYDETAPPTDAACELGLGLSEMTPPEQFDDDDNGLEAGEIEELAATQPEQFDEVDEASPHDPSRVAAATPAHELGKYVCALPLCGGRSFSGEHGLLNHMRDARAHKELPADHPLSSSRAAVLAPRRRDAAAAFAKKATSGNTAGTKKKRVLEEDQEGLQARARKYIRDALQLLPARRDLRIPLSDEDEDKLLMLFGVRRARDDEYAAADLEFHGFDTTDEEAPPSADIEQQQAVLAQRSFTPIAEFTPAGRGRGKARTLPAWMTREPSTPQAPPSTELPDWPNSRPQSKDTVRAYGSTTDTERGVEGQLIGIDGDDGIIKLPDGDYKIMNMSNLVKVVDARGFGS